MKRQRLRRWTELPSLRPLRQRQFALVWSAALVSNVGSWVQTVAVGVLVTSLTGQARWTGLVAAAAFVPVGVLSPVGGAIADRVDRRGLLLGTWRTTAAAPPVGPARRSRERPSAQANRLIGQAVHGFTGSGGQGHTLDIDAFRCLMARTTQRVAGRAGISVNAIRPPTRWPLTSR